MLPEPIKKNLPYIIIGAIIAIGLWPKFFITLIIIGIIIFIIFNKQLLPLIIKYTSMNPQTINYANLATKGIKGIKAIIISVIVLIFVIILLANMIVVIPAGHTGVYHLFGKVKDNEIKSGLHLINPLANVETFSIKTEEYTMSIIPGEGVKMRDDSIDALTKEGLKVNLDVTVLYHMIEDKASDVYKNIGVNYDEKIIRPEVRNSIREVIALYDAKDIYSEKRQEATAKIVEKLQTIINPRGIEIEEVLLRNVALPALLTKSIEEKLTAEQEAQKYDFILLTEAKEAERKRIEAEGQRDSQKIINESLSAQYLQYLYIKEIKDRQGTIYVPYDLPLLKGL